MSPGAVQFALESDDPLHGGFNGDRGRGGGSPVSQMSALGAASMRLPDIGWLQSINIPLSYPITHLRIHFIYYPINTTHPLPCLSVCLSICLSVCLPVCLSVTHSNHIFPHTRVDIFEGSRKIAPPDSSTTGQGQDTNNPSSFESDEEINEIFDGGKGIDGGLSLVANRIPSKPSDGM